MAKTQTTDLKALSIFWLKEEGFFEGGVRTGGVRWMKGSHERGAVKLAGVLLGDHQFVRVRYWLQKDEDDEQREYIHEIPITNTDCFFGGERYWFVCTRCQRRCAILYLHQGEIGCRVCRDLAYESQQYWWHGWYSVLTRTLGRAMDAEKELEQMRVKNWKGKPTKKVRQLLSEMSFELSL